MILHPNKYMITTYLDDELIVAEDFKTKIKVAIANEKEISLVTYVLGNSGEEKLKYIIQSILEKFQKIELMELLYTACKELTINSTKAAIKRLLFIEQNIDPHNINEYEKGMSSFKENLNHKKFPYYRQKMKEHNLYVKINFTFDYEKIILKIINNFPLLQQEELRIREKFVKAKKYDSLFEFYLEHGDNTEGAGMGITLVEILMHQCGFDRHLFTIYSSQERQETVAKILLPIHPEYIAPRFYFEKELYKNNIPIDKLREAYTTNEL